MSDGTVLPWAEGSGGLAKVIKARLGPKFPMGPTTLSAPVEVVSNDPYYNNEPEELVVLGAMEYEVMPAERAEKAKKSKPYDQKDQKKGIDQNVPKDLPKMQPNQAYIELPPTMILKWPVQEQST